MYKRGLFLFHRDLRVDDNIGFIEALHACTEALYCVFIFTPQQVSSSNSYKSDNAVQFMIESLEDLAEQIKTATNGKGKLLTFYGNNTTVVQYLVRVLHLDLVAYNLDYSPFAIERDRELRETMEKQNVFCLETHDYYLFPPGTIGVGTSKKPYQKFTPFYDHILTRTDSIPHPARFPSKFFMQRVRGGGSQLPKEVASRHIDLGAAMKRFVHRENSDILVHGGRTKGLVQFRRHAIHLQDKYDSLRDQFTYETTYLSAYIKFGCLSIREVYYGIRNKYGLRSGLLRELMWREFFAQVLYGFPEVLRGSFQEKYRKLKWSKSRANYAKWMEGRTGFPLVDACMRQMNATGYMHNRGRMVVATFLVKTLLLPWKWGEQYFATKLTDYDPASNNGNWQSISSTGVDGKPYYRDMNPWIQSQAYDSAAEYILKWVPELKGVNVKDIHRWNTAYEKYPKHDYPKPIVDYSEQKDLMMQMYSAATSS